MGRPGTRKAGIGRSVGGAARRRGALLLLLVACGGCEVEWGGARVALEDPAPPPREPAAPEREEERAAPLPAGPLLYALRPTGGETALVTPVATLPVEGGLPASLDLPDPLPPEYRARFDSAFLRAGTELTLQRWGRRIGTVVLGSARPPADPGCPSVVEGSLLLLPGQGVPRTAIALPPGLSSAEPGRAPTVEPPQDMTVAAPVIAERLIGEDRAYLARRVSLQAVRLAGDTAADLAATYLIEDSLTAGPPAGDAVSLFFLSVADPARGYVTRWSEIRRYATPEEKEAFEYLDWALTPSGRLHLLRRFGGDDVRLAAAFVREGAQGEDRRVEWTEGARCPAPARLEGER